jgi:DinB family protein
MTVSAEERSQRIERYARGPALLREALERVPEEARQWRPGPGKWSVHEIVCHCADSETNGAGRIRYVVAEKEPVVVGYDQEHWARAFDYHSLPVDTALRCVEGVRAHTAALIRRLPAEAWSRQGRHTESGAYGAEDWLRVYAEHLEKHAGQIDRTYAAWKAGHGG